MAKPLLNYQDVTIAQISATRAALDEAEIPYFEDLPESYFSYGGPGKLIVANDMDVERAEIIADRISSLNLVDAEPVRKRTNKVSLLARIGIIAVLIAVFASGYVEFW